MVYSTGSTDDRAETLASGASRWGPNIANCGWQAIGPMIVQPKSQGLVTVNVMGSREERVMRPTDVLNVLFAELAVLSTVDNRPNNSSTVSPTLSTYTVT